MIILLLLFFFSDFSVFRVILLWKEILQDLPEYAKPHLNFGICEWE